MKKVLFAMLVSGMLYGCTNNKSEETTSADSVEVSQSEIQVETEEFESAELETTAAEVEADSIEVVE